MNACAGCVRLGDRLLSRSAHDQFTETLRCWFEDGEWKEEQDLLYDPVIPADMRNGQLVTPVYENCGPALSRADLFFSWSTPTCSLPQFSPTAMCHAMRGRTLMFVGDSLTIAHWETTLQAMAHGRPSMMGSGRHNGCVSQSDGPAMLSWHIAHTYDFCAELGALPFNVSYTCHNHILSGYFPATTPEILDYNRTWRAHRDHLRALDSGPGLVLVVNRGAWVREDIDVAAGMYSMMRFVREDLPKTLFVFRSSNMAHRGCREYSTPRARGEPLLEPSGGANEPPTWRWSFFPGQARRIVKPIVEDNRFVARGVVLDVLPAMQLRPDAHTDDCLHYCIPGPIDQWVRWVFAIIVEVDRLGVQV